MSEVDLEQADKLAREIADQHVRCCYEPEERDSLSARFMWEQKYSRAYRAYTGRSFSKSGNDGISTQNPRFLKDKHKRENPRTQLSPDAGMKDSAEEACEEGLSLEKWGYPVSSRSGIGRTVASA